MDIKNTPKKKAKEIRTFAIDGVLYNEFKKESQKLNFSMSGIISEFIKRVVSLLKTGEGGEVVFGIEGSNWEQPKKVVYDGREITERDGIRKNKKEIDKK